MRDDTSDETTGSLERVSLDERDLGISFKLLLSLRVSRDPTVVRDERSLKVTYTYIAINTAA